MVESCNLVVTLGKLGKNEKGKKGVQGRLPLSRIIMKVCNSSKRSMSIKHLN
jgi:hypothetical protein